MADKKSIFDKYKSIDENGEIKEESVEENQNNEEKGESDKSGIEEDADICREGLVFHGDFLKKRNTV